MVVVVLILPRPCSKILPLCPEEGLPWSRPRPVRSLGQPAEEILVQARKPAADLDLAQELLYGLVKLAMESRGMRTAAERERGVWKRRPLWVGRLGMTLPGKEVRRRKEARTHEWRPCQRRTNRHWNLVSPTICWLFAVFQGRVVDVRTVGLDGRRRMCCGSMDAFYLITCVSSCAKIVRFWTIGYRVYDCEHNMSTTWWSRGQAWRVE